jgi:hypothetical protein
MPYMTPERFILPLQKTPVILEAVLGGISQEQAERLTDGPDGWNVVQVMCHLRDFEAIFFERVKRAVNEDLPKFTSVDQEVVAKNLGHENLAAALAAYKAKRQEFLAYLGALAEAQWQRRGIHPAFGEMSVIELALNVSLHDVNHIEQMAKIVG